MQLHSRLQRRDQNKADLDRLTRRLYQLLCHVSNSPAAQGPLEQSRRDMLIKYDTRHYISITNEFNIGIYQHIDCRVGSPEEAPASSVRITQHRTRNTWLF